MTIDTTKNAAKEFFSKYAIDVGTQHSQTFSRGLYMKVQMCRVLSISRRRVVCMSAGTGRAKEINIHMVKCTVDH